ncbi:hypothetical protein [Campylobacter pinnipediorum]|uniref:hypothetical protein n=1 Tax=Campylobacter pinnipediorum TaxID=1965231 RepID=UPI00084D851D|nr:hypothetical protein [Campylobacter pinnipediorum]
MDIFFIGHRDPIFGLIVLFSIIFMVAFFSYAWGIFSKKDEKRKIEKFIKKFDNSNSISDNHKQLLKNLDIDSNDLGVLAMTFVKSGDFEKAISIYLIALSKVKNKIEKEFILTQLGSVYFKAGFLQNSMNIFLQAVQISPRNEIALRFLTMIDEKLKKFNEALQTLDSLQELGADVKTARAYIKANIVLNDKELSIDEKTDKILKYSNDFALLKRMAMQLWIKNNKSLETFPSFLPISDVIDILYQQNMPLNLEDEEYKALFYAKGIIKEKAQINNFELNVIKNLKDTGFDKADLSFNYVCNSCKNSFPMHFYRCPMCHSLGSVKILSQITEKNDENNMPF